MKAIGVIGYHHTGKTTLVCALIQELTRLGHKVVSIKDIHNESYRVDTEEKNTWLHTQAGSKAVFAKGLHDSALLFPTTLNLNEMITFLKADYLIIEGLKDAPVPKFVCAENTTQLDELIDGTTIGISGLIADKLDTYKDLPVFCLKNNLKKLIDTAISNSFDILPLSDPECCSACGKSCHQMAIDIVQGISRRSDCVLDTSPDIKLSIGGQDIVIVPFVQKLLRDMILAFVDNLKDIDPKGNIKIEITR